MRNHMRWMRGIALLVAGLGQAISALATDITFFQVSDTHYKTNSNHAAAIERINALPQEKLPGGLAVGVPLGVIASGDLIDAGPGGRAMRETQWGLFTADFGLTGKEGKLKFPVYEGYGNHDQDGWLEGMRGQIAERNKTRPGVVRVSQNGVHYSWDWGPVHFVQLNIRVGAGPQRYNPLDSLGFLKETLEKNVGRSGRPVILVHHLPVPSANSDWPEADHAAYHEAIKDYNVIAILWGHKHAFVLGTWHDIPTFQADSFGKGFSVFRIVADKDKPDEGTLTVAQRKANGTWGAVKAHPIKGLAVPVKAAAAP